VRSASPSLDGRSSRRAALPALAGAAIALAALSATADASAQGLSVKDPKSPYAARSCKLTQHIANPTAFEADCRCLDNRGQTDGIDHCKRPYDLAKSGGTIASGPSFALWPNAHISGGFVDAASNKLIASVYWSGSSTPKGVVVSYDLSNWSRTIVSGTTKSPAGEAEVGSGPAFTHVKDVQPGKDGKWYALTHKPQRPEIVRVDPSTGARTLVWAGGNTAYGQCPSGTPEAASAAARTVQYTAEGFAVDADGSYLLGYANPTRDGRGIVRISADGKSCSYVTASGNRPDKLTKGTGDEMRGFVQGFELHEGKIWAFTTGEKKLWTVDPATGNRIVLGSPPLGERFLSWDAKRKVMWTSGFRNSVTLGAFDPAKSKFMNVFQDCAKDVSWFPLCAEGPIRVNSLNYGLMVVNPKTGTLLIGHDSVGLVEFEPETGNSVTRSL
jgi:hypothetical protein